MNFKALTAYLASHKEPPFRAKQVRQAFFVDLRSSWADIPTLPRALRESLADEIPWDDIKPVHHSSSEEGKTQKVLFQCEDDSKIEAVLMRHTDGRETVCVSCQVGCAMKCAFCATGTLGCKRNLTAEEMVAQVIYFARWLKEHAEETPGRITNVVFMGMGEPFHNYEQVMEAVRTLNNPEGLNIGARHISVSTCGVVPGILRLAEEPLQVNLAISLHAAIEETRRQLMPVARAYSLRALRDAVRVYIQKTNRRVFLEYVLLRGVNDTEEDAQAIANWIGSDGKLFHVNVIKFHPSIAHGSKEGGLAASDHGRRVAFLHWLARRGVSATYRINFGEELDAACGQLAAKKK